MTAPRRILAGSTLMVTRRCLGRMFLLRPSKRTNELIGYVVGVAAQRHRIRLHALCVMSNHLHIVLTDPEGRLPEFERDLDGLAARSFNALLRRCESFWAPGSYNAVTLDAAEDVVAKVAYVLANPVAAGLVRRGEEWPGLRSSPRQIGGAPTTVVKPAGFFRRTGPLPESAELAFHCPPGFDSVEAFRELLVRQVNALEAQARRELAAQGRSFLGAWRVLTQKAHARPRTQEPRRELRPTVACRDEARRKQLLLQLEAFRAAYREAWLVFSQGARRVLFPHGTYWMRVAFNVSCATDA